MKYQGDNITVRSSGGGQYDPHPEGTFGAVCVDVIDLGDRVEQFADNPARVVHKVALVFATGEQRSDGGLATVQSEMTCSMHEKARLRGFLESWRGRTYTPEQVELGVPIGKLAGNPALITVEHKTSKAGRTYATIRAVSPVPKQMEAPEVNGYERAEYWTERKAEYAREVAKFHAEAHGDNEDDPPPPADDDYTGEPEDELPF
jgi:hypothetical protein